MDETTFILLYKCMAVLMFVNSVWCPFKQGDIKDTNKSKEGN